MRFHVVSLHEAAERLDAPFRLQPLAQIDEYSCFLYRCEGQLALHRHTEHDELFWPLDRPIRLLDEGGELAVQPGELACVRRGWRHASAAEIAAHVLLISRGERSLSLNGHLNTILPLPPRIINPLARLADAPHNVPVPLLRCDTLQVYAERIEGTGPARTTAHDLLVVPLTGNVGLRCGGMITVVEPWHIARLPARSGWHLFGNTTVMWMSAEYRKE